MSSPETFLCGIKNDGAYSAAKNNIALFRKPLHRLANHHHAGACFLGYFPEPRECVARTEKSGLNGFLDAVNQLIDERNPAFSVDCEM